MTWGHHLIIDARKCYPALIRNKAHITRFTKALVTAINMVPYGEPQVVHFGTGNKAGYTMVQLIETSNICAHFVEETNDMYLDVFSCKEFKKHTVEDAVSMWFQPEKIHGLFIERGNFKNESSSNNHFLQ